MKTLKEFVTEKLKVSKNTEEILKEEHKETLAWIKNNYSCAGLQLSEYKNEDGKFEAYAKDVNVTNHDLTELTNGEFVWTEIEQNFYIGECNKLLSLEGAPHDVHKNFYLEECRSLKSLEGGPDRVDGDFYCISCDSLTSLVGAPKSVGKDFILETCLNLESLKGMTEKIGKRFKLYYCNKLKNLEGGPKRVGECSVLMCAGLTSLEGAPQEIDGNFVCKNNKLLKSMQLPSYTKLKGEFKS